MTVATRVKPVVRPTESVEIECKYCDGEGGHVSFEGPGTEWGYGWIPREVWHECGECDGKGKVWAERCVRCHRLEDDCVCDDDDFAEVA